MSITKQALIDHWAGIVTSCTPANEKGLFSCTVKGLFTPDRNAEFEATEQIASSSIVQISGSGDDKQQRQGDTRQTLQYRILAEPGSANAHIYSLLGKFDLDPYFPAACEKEALAWQDNPGLDDKALEDLTHLPFVTIDNTDSRDLDQAVYVEYSSTPADSPPQQATVYYALADASYYVIPGTALFKEALRRGVTYYAPDLAVSMLPVSLSEGLVSLNPDVLRRSLMFRITLDSTGTVKETTVSRALIKSRAKLSYAGVEKFLLQKDDPQSLKIKSSEYAESLLAMREAGKWRIQEAASRDVIDYERTEASVTTEKGKFVINRRDRYSSEQYNEQISLLCNMEGARLLNTLKPENPTLYSIFRVHAPPLEKRLLQLRQNINELVEARSLSSDWQWQEGTAIHDYVNSLPHEKSQEATQAPLRQVIQRMILLTNRASLFDDEPGSHHALGVDLYARFSSPMREMVGIFLHKELLEALGLAESPQTHKDTDAAFQQQIVEQANAARKLQKKLEQEARLFAIDEMLRADLDLPMEQRPVRKGTIMGMRGGKIYVAIDGFGTDIKLYTEDLAQHFKTQYSVEKQSAGPSPRSTQGTENKESSAPVFVTADRVQLQTLKYEEKKRRFVLTPLV